MAPGPCQAAGQRLQEGTGPGLHPRKATRDSCVTVGASGYSPHPRRGPLGQAPGELGVPGSGQCWGGGRGRATCWPRPGAGDPGEALPSRGEEPRLQL